MSQFFQETIRKRVNALKYRIDKLDSLNSIVSLNGTANVHQSQWVLLTKELSNTKGKLLSRLNMALSSYRKTKSAKNASFKLVDTLGKLELDLTKSYGFFDTYVDILTQRSSNNLGKLLAGCDVLAWDSLLKNHKKLRKNPLPLVYTDRGFGASILRSNVRFPDGTLNPIPLIQVPYTRLTNKYALASIAHEVGHEVFVQTGLIKNLGKLVAKKLESKKASPRTVKLFSLWTHETMPDFWSFCNTGCAQVLGLMGMLTLPAKRVFRLSLYDPHPMPYYRVIQSLSWSRLAFGKKESELWLKQWQALYPLTDLGKNSLIKELNKFLPTVNDIYFNTKFKELENRRLTDFFDLKRISSNRFSKKMSDIKDGRIHFKDWKPNEQLGWWAFYRDKVNISEEKIDKLMTNWLYKLAENKNQFIVKF